MHARARGESSVRHLTVASSALRRARMGASFLTVTLCVVCAACSSGSHSLSLASKQAIAKLESSNSKQQASAFDPRVLTAFGGVHAVIPAGASLRVDRSTWRESGRTASAVVKMTLGSSTESFRAHFVYDGSWKLLWTDSAA
jgi:hypothetical protein